MKITPRLTHAMFLLLLTCSLLQGTPAVWAQSPAAPEAADKPMRAGIAKVVGGEVRVLGTQGMRTLEPGDAVFSGDRLVSGKYGLVSVVLRDGTTVVLGNNSQLQIQKFAFDATTADGNILLDLLQGSIRVLTGVISKINPDAVQVKTSTLLVGVRGTDFIVEAEEPFPF
ncbi:MAG: FecR domain-containing protein [Polaromonas sp.]|nr:FecR domain-containing protein [Polaromonas sp.]